MRNLTIAAALTAGLLVFSGIPSSHAAPLPSANKSFAADSAVHEARHGRYCRRWHWICRDRWGWGWRYRRCMWRHGC